MRTKLILLGVLVGIAILIGFMMTRSEQKISSFTECESAGYPIMESYPRQCRVPGGELFVEILSEPLPNLSETEFGVQASLHIGEKITFPDGLEVTLKEINDSRCQIDVQCIWAGELSPLFVVTGGSFGIATSSVRLGTSNNKTVTAIEYSFTLASATTTEVVVVVTKNSPPSGDRVAAGYISGHVTIGPICPVERVDEPCEVPPETYTSRNVVVYESDKVTVREKKTLDAKGNYTIALGPGIYFVQIQPAGIGEGEKKKVTVTSFNTSTIDFDIDTGIR